MEGPWEIPSNWHWEPLGQLGSWVGGGTPSKDNPQYWAGGDIPWVSPKDMKAAYLDDSEDHITEAAMRASSTKLVPENSVVCVMRSGILRHSFPVAVVRRQVTLNQDLRAISPRTGIDAAFLAHFLRASAQEILHTCSKDGTTVNSIETSRLLAHPVPVPQFDIQRRIAARIDEFFAEIDDGRSALADARAGLETYRKSLLNAAVTGELTADWRRISDAADTARELVARTGKRRAKKSRPDDIAPFELPPRWCWATLGEIGDVTGGLTQNSKRMALPLKQPFLRVANVFAGRLDLNDVEVIGVRENEVERALLRPNDLLIVEGNGSLSQIGRGAIWDGSIPNCLHQNHLIKVRFVEPTLALWVQQWLQSPRGRMELEERASSTSGLHTLSISKVQSLRCPIPPLSEISAIQRIIETNSTEIDTTGTELIGSTTLGAVLRQSILVSAFRGQLAI